MPELCEQLSRALQGRVAFVGIGNVEMGDDGFGIVLLEKLAAECGTKVSGLEQSASRVAEPTPKFIMAGTNPEEFVIRLGESDLDNVIFLDAVDFGGGPGGVVFLESEEISARFPQISTHKLSLGLLAKLVEAAGHAKAWLLGVQPAHVAQTSSLLYRGFPIRRRHEPSNTQPTGSRRPAELDQSRLETCATAECALSSEVQASIRLLSALAGQIMARRGTRENKEVIA